MVRAVLESHMIIIIIELFIRNSESGYYLVISRMGMSLYLYARPLVRYCFLDLRAK